MNAQAILFTAPHQVSLENVQIPEPGPGEVLLAASYTAISPGTELRCLAGKEAGLEFPFIPGYSFVGQVIDQGPGADLPSGAWFFCTGTARASANRGWGGHCSLAVLPERDVYRLPEGVEPLAAAGVKLAAIAYRGVRLAQPAPHETVVVAGLGAIGQCSARLFSAAGARVIGADLSPHRVQVCQAAGIEAHTPQGSLAQAFEQILPGGADIVVDATGAPSVLPAALDIARPKPWDDSPLPGARVVIQGSFPGDFQVPYRAAFMKELSLWVPRDVQPADIRAVLSLLERGKLSLDGVISAVCQPDTAPQTYARLADPGSGWISAAFQWRSA